VFLAFGAYHSGKDLETIFRALKNLPEVYFVHAGSQAFGLGVNLEEVARDYIDANRMSIRNYYVPEREKPYYFFAADAVILSYTKQFLSTSSLLWEACRQLKELMMAFQPGLLFSAQDPDSLGEAIIRFISLKPAEIKVMKNNCHRFVEQFSMDKWVLTCLELYNGLFEEPKKG
jgi:glycosyltransferase involved in cell wall biosynthesis